MIFPQSKAPSVCQQWQQKEEGTASVKGFVGTVWDLTTSPLLFAAIIVRKQRISARLRALDCSESSSKALFEFALLAEREEQHSQNQQR